MQAALHTETVEYTLGHTPFQGYVAYDTTLKGKRPGVLVVPEWWGLNLYAKHRAEMLAQLGYVAFAADMYGYGFNTTSPDEARKHSGPLLNDRSVLRKRIQAALDTLRKQPTVGQQDGSRRLAIVSAGHVSLSWRVAARTLRVP